MTHIDMMHKLSDQIIGLKALNAELLDVAEAALTYCCDDTPHPAIRKTLVISARAVIAKAKELE